jgi:hypothetical protein
MTIRIEKETDRLKTMIRVSGRLQSTHLDELKTQLEGARARITLDLNGVTLVDVETIRFLNACEKGGVELLNSRPYIQEWMIRETKQEGIRSVGSGNQTRLTHKKEKFPWQIQLPPK